MSFDPMPVIPQNRDQALQRDLIAQAADTITPPEPVTVVSARGASVRIHVHGPDDVRLVVGRDQHKTINLHPDDLQWLREDGLPTVLNLLGITKPESKPERKTKPQRRTRK